MKKIALWTITAALLLIALFFAIALSLNLYREHQSHLPGKLGHNLEFRLEAMNGDTMKLITRQRSNYVPVQGGDVFADADALRFIKSGETPSGFIWLPMADSLHKDTNESGGQIVNADITRMSNGRMYGLVSDGPSMCLTHGAGTPVWGVRSVELNEPTEPRPRVTITLDDAGGNLMYALTSRYTGHYLAVVAGGQILQTGRIASIVRDTLQFEYGYGERLQAEKLRDLLLSGAN
jgi:hypothetical protein